MGQEDVFGPLIRGKILSFYLHRKQRVQYSLRWLDIFSGNIRSSIFFSLKISPAPPPPIRIKRSLLKRQCIRFEFTNGTLYSFEFKHPNSKKSTICIAGDLENMRVNILLRFTPRLHSKTPLHIIHSALSNTRSCTVSVRKAVTVCVIKT